jgi:hypothetical protein
VGLAKQRDFVDGVVDMHGAMHVGGAHQQRMDHGIARCAEACMQVERGKLVHQEADGAAVHAVDRLAGPHLGVQRLQHQAVAAERNHDVGIVRIVIAVTPCQLRQRVLGFRARARDKGDAVVLLGRGHGSRAHDGAKARVVYTIFPALVETT